MATIGILRETYPGERRVALVPTTIAKLKKSGLEVKVEAGAGKEAGYPDDEYAQAGAPVVERREVLACDLVAGVRILGAAGESWSADLEGLGASAVIIGMCDPLGAADVLRDAGSRGWTVVALEMIPRITRAQSMDVLSSMATVAGYRAVLLGAVELPRMFPLLMTAAGTVTAARVFVIGAGVAGLQALATAKRLGATTQAYDVRAACREQVESVGAKFIELSLPETSAEDQGGYAKELAEDFYRQQRELMASVVAESDVVITTAAIPGKPSPLLVTEQAVKGMAPGSVIVDLAAERGGNCELTQPDQRVQQHGVTILGPTNLPSEVPYHASQMFSNNIANYLRNLVKDGQIAWNMDDEIIRETVVVRDGDVVHPRIRSILGLDPLPQAAAEQTAAVEETAAGDPPQPESSGEDGDSEDTAS